MLELQREVEANSPRDGGSTIAEGRGGSLQFTPIIGSRGYLPSGLQLRGLIEYRLSTEYCIIYLNLHSDYGVIYNPHHNMRYFEYIIFGSMSCILHAMPNPRAGRTVCGVALHRCDSAEVGIFGTDGVLGIKYMGPLPPDLLPILYVAHYFVTQFRGRSP